MFDFHLGTADLPSCSNSFGVIQIRKHLTAFGIQQVHEVFFSSSVSGRKLKRSSPAGKSGARGAVGPFAFL
jgi:hypothetical protein